jgi:hypothetical protein
MEYRLPARHDTENERKARDYGAAALAAKRRQEALHYYRVVRAALVANGTLRA